MQLRKMRNQQSEWRARSARNPHSYQKKGASEPIHIVSAFAARQRLVLGQVKVAEKSNEIVAIPIWRDNQDWKRRQSGLE
jgi:hypothetical protein